MTDEPVVVDLPVVMGDRRLSGTRRLSVALGLSLIVAASVAVRVALAIPIEAPSIFHDELIYWELGRGLGETGHWMVGDQPLRGWAYGPLYPLLIAPTHLVTSSLVEAYALTKILNAFVMSLTAVPAYFLARRVVSEHGALVSAALAVLVPSAVYTTHVMAESLSYPLFLTAMLAMTAALEHPSTRRQLLALAVITVSALSRTEMIVVFPAFAGAIILACWIERGAVSSTPRRLSSFKATWLVYGAGGLVLVAAVLGGNLANRVYEAMLRAVGLEGVFRTGLPTRTEAGILLEPVRPVAVPMNVVRHVAELDVYSGVIPFAAFALVTTLGLHSHWTDRRRTDFIVTTISAGAFLIALAALYETSFKLYGVFTTHVFDRYVFYLVPLFVIALVLWVEDGLPRPRRAAVAVALTAALLPLALPLPSLLTNREWGTCTCTVGMVPLVWAKLAVGDGWELRATLLAFAGALALLFLLARRRHAWSLVGITASVFVLFTLLVTVSNQLLSDVARSDAGRNSLSWVDDTVSAHARVAILWSGDSMHPQPQRVALREAEFFNRSIGSVYDLKDRLASGFPSTGVTLRGGRVVNTTTGQQVRVAYVLADRSLGVVGRPIARDRGSGLVLYRIAGPVRISH